MTSEQGQKARRTKRPPRGKAIVAGKGNASEYDNAAQGPPAEGVGNYGWQVVTLADGTIENTRLSDPKGSISWVRMKDEHASASLAIESTLQELKSALTDAITAASALDQLHPWQDAVASQEILRVLVYARSLVRQGLSFCPSKEAQVGHPEELLPAAVREMARRGIAKPEANACLYDDIRKRFLENMTDLGVSTVNAIELYEKFCAGTARKDLPRKKHAEAMAFLGKGDVCDKGKEVAILRSVEKTRATAAARRESLRKAAGDSRK